jgi:hypothetical protein
MWDGFGSRPSSLCRDHGNGVSSASLASQGQLLLLGQHPYGNALVLQSPPSPHPRCTDSGPAEDLILEFTFLPEPPAQRHCRNDQLCCLAVTNLYLLVVNSHGCLPPASSVSSYFFAPTNSPAEVKGTLPKSSCEPSVRILLACSTSALQPSESHPSSRLAPL